MLTGVASNRFWGLVVSTTVLFSWEVAVAQQSPTSVPSVTPNPPGRPSDALRPVDLANFFQTRTPYEFWLTVLVCVTGLTIIWLIVWSVGRRGETRPEELTRPIIVVTVIMSALILVIAGFSNEQIAPAFGLFGTIVGYMLGRMSERHTAARSAAEFPESPPRPNP
jgi:hypothetical protein